MRTTIGAAAALLIMAAPAASIAAFEYTLDDGTGNVNVGPPSSFDQFPNTDMIWGNYFTEQNGQNELTSIRLGVGSLVTEPRTISLIVWDDANDDNDPTDINAAPLISFDVQVTDTGLGEFLSFDLPQSVTIDGGFFVAAVLRNADPGDDAPGNLDPDSDGANSWLIYSPDLVEDDLSTSIGFATPMNNPSFVPIFGAWTIRATAIPAPAGVGALVLAGLAATRRRR